ncbi:hypothetical protein O9G_004576 [Rozella allomycis CSF55]|uniref:Uncharacterized protein n=1 Tax=Rozella allomycis (strain CSF55) TaxID=988480 RepID=A0A075AXE0_ROZAC|nr:hypothetical protein O9G_004576 [Rozella allomycis CSF55]|eukprot:EPZ34980.1 hypothetical protein O9G_004576 [Rozella allomycis CSF55]
MTSAPNYDELHAAYRALQQELNELRLQQPIPANVAPAVSSKEPKTADPRFYSEGPQELRELLLQLELSTQRNRHALTLKPRKSDMPPVSYEAPLRNEQFGIYDEQEDATERMLNLKQGKLTAAAFVAEYQRLYPLTGWNETADLLVGKLEKDDSLEKYFKMAVRMDEHLYTVVPDQLKCQIVGASSMCAWIKARFGQKYNATNYTIELAGNMIQDGTVQCIGDATLVWDTAAKRDDLADALVQALHLEEDNTDYEVAADDELEAVEELNNFDALMQLLSGNSEDAINQLMELANLDITTPEMGIADLY